MAYPTTPSGASRVEDGERKQLTNESLIWHSRKYELISIDGGALRAPTLDGRIISRESWNEIRDRVELFYDEASEQIETHNQATRTRARLEHECAVTKAKARERFGPKASGIYLILQPSTGLRKIGRSEKVVRRLGTLSLEYSEALELEHVILCDNQETAEWALHERFSHRRVGATEWFDLTRSEVTWFCTLSQWPAEGE